MGYLGTPFAARVISCTIESEDTMATPLSTLKEKFENKAKLVTELENLTKGDDLWVSRLNSSKGLAHVSNAKLLRLHATFTAVKAKFGTRAKLIDAIADIEKRSKDDGFKARLGAFPVPRLFDMWESATKRALPKAPKRKPTEKALAEAAAVKAAAAAKKQASLAVAKKTAAKGGKGGKPGKPGKKK